MVVDVRFTILPWIEVFMLAEAEHGTPIACPFCGIERIRVFDVPSRTDPSSGKRFFQYTLCENSTEARISSGGSGALFPKPDEDTNESSSHQA